MTGIESIYEMNKYTKTRSYNLLKIIYTCVKDCALDSKGNNLIGAYRKKSKEEMMPDLKLRAELCTYLVNALPLLPADLVVEYYKAIGSPNGMFKCFRILNDLFCKKTRRETRLRFIIDTYMRSRRFNQCEITHIGFFKIRKSTPDYFAINRNCKKFKISERSKSTCIFFLPKEILCLDQWFTFSVEFDKYLLETMCECFKIKRLFRSFMDLYKILGTGCSDDDKGGLDLRTCYVNLKLYSFFIISSCIPCIKQERHLIKIQEHIRHCFGHGNLNATEVLAGCFNLLNKKM
jgi:hypothetical protein